MRVNKIIKLQSALLFWTIKEIFNQNQNCYTSVHKLKKNSVTCFSERIRENKTALLRKGG